MYVDVGSEILLFVVLFYVFVLGLIMYRCLLLKFFVYVIVVLLLRFGLLIIVMVCSLLVREFVVVVIGCFDECLGVISSCGCVLNCDFVLSNVCMFVCVLLVDILLMIVDVSFVVLVDVGMFIVIMIVLFCV